MSSSPVESDAHRLAHLKVEVLTLGNCARQSVVDAVNALQGADTRKARAVIAGREQLERQYRALEASYRESLTWVPAEELLRVALLELTVTLELAGIGRHGAHIAWTVAAEEPAPRSLVTWLEVRRMSELSVGLLDRVLEAFRHADPAQARAACRLAESIDALYTETFDVLPGYHLADVRQAAYLLNLTRIVHELERVGDRATVIAERVIQTYERTELQAPA